MTKIQKTIDVATTNPAVTEMRPRLLTITQAAALLGVGRTTTYELISGGELEVVHIGRSARVPVESIDDLVSRLRARSAS
ncbi:MAG TPA: helix-turn-helix domain-containing protein [Acidimicrobiales bacterium]|nr:helix-turn-helix domain-containing protein [Acidimicrobiales bacterium]